jgi:hypothetical protein
MAQQFVRRHDGTASESKVFPVISLPHAPQAALDDEPEFFQMDSLDFMWRSEGSDDFPVWSDEVRRTTVFTCHI